MSYVPDWRSRRIRIHPRETMQAAGEPRTDGTRLVTLPQNLLNGDPVAIEAFDSATGWSVTNGTVAADATNKVEGTASLKISCASASTATTADKSVTFSLADAVAVRMAFRNPPTGVVITSGLVYHGDAAWSKYRYAGFNSNHRYWNRYQLIPADFAFPSLPWADQATLLRIKPASVNGEAPDVWVDQFEKLPALPTPAVLLTLDDGYASAYSKAFAYCQPRGVNATLYMTTDNIGAALSADNLRTMYAAGWDIANHGEDNTNLTTLTQEQSEAALTGAKAALDALGLTRASAHVAYPEGGHNDTVRAAMTAAGMLTGRTTHWLPQPTLPLIDPYTIECQGVSAATSLATAKGYIDKAISHGAICSLYFHDIVDADADGGEWLTANFQALIDYIIAQQITPLTISQLYALQSGALAIERPW